MWQSAHLKEFIPRDSFHAPIKYFHVPAHLAAFRFSVARRSRKRSGCGIESSGSHDLHDLAAPSKPMPAVLIRFTMAASTLTADGLIIYLLS